MTALSAAVYGIGSLWLVFQLWRDRVQRERHFQSDKAAGELNALRTAFYEAYGYWQGYLWTRGSADIDASQVGKQFEALVRLECQLRLNDYEVEANDLGFAIRRNLDDIQRELDKVGLALKLMPTEYRQFSAKGFTE